MRVVGMTESLKALLMQVDYALGNGGRSWVIGVGTDYPPYLWHKQSYASLINWSSRYTLSHFLSTMSTMSLHILFPPQDSRVWTFFTLNWKTMC